VQLLVIGGTSFLGRAAVVEALGRGWAVTTFNRGVSGPDVDGVEPLRGDRTDPSALGQLEHRRFDVRRRHLRLRAQCGRPVGSSAGRVGCALRVRLQHLGTTTWPGRPTPEGLDGQPCSADAGPDDGGYGELKAGCERAVAGGLRRQLDGRSGRPDHRPARERRPPALVARADRPGGEVLAPGDPAEPMQLVDARDLAAFMLDCGEHRTGGTFNATRRAATRPSAAGWRTAWR
jgi:2'-hydroxyisoflavone reductase